jgi:Protein of unknown function (DUF3489)
MRVYIIGNHGITLCRKASATLNDGEIAVASNEDLHAVTLSAKRLLALWNALPGVERRKKVGDREALIDQLWSAIEQLPDPEPEPDPKRPSKQDLVIAVLRQPEGATVDEVASVTGWQRHTVRGVFSGTLKKKLGLTLTSANEERGRVLSHRRGGEPMSLVIHGTSGREKPGEPSSSVGQAANRQNAVSKEALSRLLTLDIGELRQQWRGLYKTQAPRHLSRPLRSLACPSPTSANSACQGSRSTSPFAPEPD